MSLMKLKSLNEHFSTSSTMYMERMKIDANKGESLDAFFQEHGGALESLIAILEVMLTHWLWKAILPKWIKAVAVIILAALVAFANRKTRKGIIEQ